MYALLFFVEFLRKVFFCVLGVYSLIVRYTQMLYLYNLCIFICSKRAGIAQSPYGWRVRRSNSGRVAPVQTGCRAHPASYTIGTGSFPRVKRSGRDFEHPPTPSSADVKERVELTSTSPLGLRGLF
jgi:hypothetical protein